MIRAILALLLPSTWRSPYASLPPYIPAPQNYEVEAPEPGGPFDYA